jgi:DNA-binding NtrC family response regulator
MMDRVACVEPSLDPVTPSQGGGFDGIVGRSIVMQKLRRIVAVAANSLHPVLIYGESGSGKRMIARAIRSGGPFRDRAFISIDCGSMAPALFSKQLFDPVTGAFAGPTQPANGLIAIAQGGTIFLDKVEELDFALQTKLFQLLQDIQNSQTSDAPVNVRFLVATTHDLERVVMQGGFRKDLYFRLNVLSLRIPPLRDHRDDIPLLAEHFLERMMRASGNKTTLSEHAVQAMLLHDWPGNVLELKECLERACAFASGLLIQVRDLPPEIVRARHATVPKQKNEYHIVPMAEVEKQAILNAVAELKGDKAQAARLLGIGKTTLYRRLQQYASRDLGGLASKAISNVA